MAKFKSIVTDGGSEALTALIASGQKLILTRAAAGSGVAQVSPNTLTDLVNVENVSANLSEKELVEGSPSIMQIPVQVTNEGNLRRKYISGRIEKIRSRPEGGGI